MWFTPGDLRLHDHPALASETEEEEKVPLFVFDPTYLATQPPHALSLQLRAVRDLRASLQRAGGDLVVRTGRAEEIVPEMVKVRSCVCVFVMCVVVVVGQRLNRAAAATRVYCTLCVTNISAWKCVMWSAVRRLSSEARPKWTHRLLA